MKKIAKLAIFLLIGFSACILTACFGGKEPVLFSISGCVYDGDSPVEGVVLTSDFGTATSDEDGHFCFDNISSGITITAEKSGYTFEKNSQTFFEATNSANFSALKFYTIAGKVLSDTTPVANVKVSASAIKGGYTFSNGQGEFILYNIAGDATIMGEKDGYTFFDTSADIGKSQNIVVNSITKATVNVNFIGLSNQFKDGTKIFVGQEEIPYEDDKVINSLKLGTVIKLVNENLSFSPGSFTITKENMQCDFSAQKIYNLSGKCVSGNKLLENVVVTYGGNITTTNSYGEFIFNNVYGNGVLSASLKDFIFEKQNFNETNNNITFIGTTNLKGKINFEEGQSSVVKVKCGDKETQTKDGVFSFSNLQLGQNVEIISDVYHFDKSIILVDTPNKEEQILAQKLYDVSILCRRDDDEILTDAKATIGEMSYISDGNGIIKIENLYGNVETQITKDGYYSNNLLALSLKNNNFECKLYELYDATIKFTSNDYLLSNINVVVNEEIFTTNENGIIVLNNQHSDVFYTFSVENYNNSKCNISLLDNIKVLNLSYNIAGYVKTGNKPMSNVVVNVGENKTITDKNGYFTVEKLFGCSSVLPNQELCDFGSAKQVNCGQTLNFDCKYTVKGVVLNGEDFVVGTSIHLINSIQENEQVCETNNQGEFIFENIIGENLLFYVDSNGLKLKPLSYTINKGGQYDFLLNGFELGGYVICGENPIENVKLTAGTTSVYSDENGYYYFNLIKTDCEIVAVLDGYVFTPSTILVSSDDNERINVNFTASYTVSGKVLFGENPLGDVEISVGDKTVLTDSNGDFNISGIIGGNKLVITKEGYTFSYNDNLTCADYIPVNAFILVSGIVKCGELNVKNVSVKYDSIQTTTDDNGAFNLTIPNLNSNLLLAKEGYVFDCTNLSIEPAKQILITCSYKMVGKIVSGENSVKNCQITVNYKTYNTDEMGEFIIENLVGENIVSFSKQGYKFNNVNVNSFTNLKVVGTYQISGHILLGENGVANVSVSTQNKSTLTDSNGFYILDGLQGSDELVIEKLGYSFVGETSFTESKVYDFTTTFYVSGVVKSGNELLSSASVTIGNNEVFTDSNGKFTIFGLTPNSTIVFTKSGFSKVEKTYNDFTENEEINLTYSITVIFTGIDDYSQITVILDNEEKITNNSSNVFAYLTGEFFISFTKEGYLFTPAKVGVNSPCVLTIQIQKIYSVEGYVKTSSSSIPVSGMKIVAGSKSTYTDANGYYKLNGLVGKVAISGELSYNGCNSVSTSLMQVQSAEAVNFKIDLNNYLFFRFQYGYQVLKNAKSSYVEISGQVDAGNLGGIQQVRAIRRSDKNGNILSQRMNYGNPVMGIDPRVSLLTYYNPSSSQAMYQHITGDKISSSYVATYGGWSNISSSDYKSKYGVYPYEDYAYIITTNTISSFESISQTNGELSFKMVLNPSTSTTNYAVQMKALSGQTIKKFNHVYLAFTYNINNYIKTLAIDENYDVSVVTAQGNITETYKIQDAETTLEDINTNDIYHSLEYHEQSNLLSKVLSMPTKKFILKGAKNEI